MTAKKRRTYTVASGALVEPGASATIFLGRGGTTIFPRKLIIPSHLARPFLVEDVREMLSSGKILGSLLFGRVREGILPIPAAMFSAVEFGESVDEILFGRARGCFADPLGEVGCEGIAVMLKHAFPSQGPRQVECVLMGEVLVEDEAP
jgi:hypothetical protein